MKPENCHLYRFIQQVVVIRMVDFCIKCERRPNRFFVVAISQFHISGCHNSTQHYKRIDLTTLSTTIRTIVHVFELCEDNFSSNYHQLFVNFGSNFCLVMMVIEITEIISDHLLQLKIETIIEVETIIQKRFLDIITYRCLQPTLPSLPILSILAAYCISSCLLTIATVYNIIVHVYLCSELQLAHFVAIEPHVWATIILSLYPTASCCRVMLSWSTRRLRKQTLP